MQSSSPASFAIRRRGLLRLMALVPAATAVAAGCQPKPREPDQLAALAADARADGAFAQVIASAHPALADKAGAVAAARTEHARALQREIDRLNPPKPDAPPPPAPPARPAPPSPTEAKNTLAEALRTAQRSSSDLVPVVPAYRAGLLGSVSASCASLLEVLG